MSLHGVSSSQAPYLKPVQASVVVSLLTVGDTVPLTDYRSHGPLGQPELHSTSDRYMLVGYPDGMGLTENVDDPRTFILTLNHEIRFALAGKRAHGAKGGFVSRWIIQRDNLNVMSGRDLIISKAHVHRTGPALAGGMYVEEGDDLNDGVFFSKLCSGDVAPASAYYNERTGLGTRARIHAAGEEVRGGRAWAFIVTGEEAGRAYQLPRLGYYYFENLLANPFMQDMTLVAGTEDKRVKRTDGTEEAEGNVVFYVGTKTNTGNVVERAGLQNGKLYGLRIKDYPLELVEPVPFKSVRFFLDEIPWTKGPPWEGEGEDRSGYAGYNAHENLRLVDPRDDLTVFQRAEDGIWDKNRPSRFYFATTICSKLWRLDFDDISNPTRGGMASVILEGPNNPGEGYDNLAMSPDSRTLLVTEDGEDENRGNNLWSFDISGDKVQIPGGARLMGQHSIGSQGEFSGIVDASEFLGPGWYLGTDMAHRSPLATLSPAERELAADDGQIYAFFDATAHRDTPPVITGVVLQHIAGPFEEDADARPRFYAPVELQQPHNIRLGVALNLSSVAFEPNALAGVTEDRITKYAFDFGDGNPTVSSTRPWATHLYQREGDFPVRLQATDSTGLTGLFSLRVRVRSNSEMNPLKQATPPAIPFLPYQSPPPPNKIRAPKPAFLCPAGKFDNASWPEAGPTNRWQGVAAKCLKPFVGTAVRKCSRRGGWGPLLEPCWLGCPAKHEAGADWPENEVSEPGMGVEIECKQGSGFTGSAIRVCQPNYQWGPILVACAPMCPAQSVAGAEWEEAAPDSQLSTGTCTEGLTGKPTRRCREDGIWGSLQGEPCRCIENCSCPAETIAGVPWPQSFPGPVAMSCPSGETLTRICGPRGVWEGNTPRSCGGPGRCEVGAWCASKQACLAPIQCPPPVTVKLPPPPPSQQATSPPTRKATSPPTRKVPRRTAPPTNVRRTKKPASPTKAPNTGKGKGKGKKGKGNQQT